MTDTISISHENLGYEKNSAESIYNYALLLTDKSLSEAVKLPENVENLKG